MSATAQTGRFKHHLDLLGRLLHSLATLIIIATTAGWSISLETYAYSADPQCRPNIVLILADDLGWGDLAATAVRSKRRISMRWRIRGCVYAVLQHGPVLADASGTLDRLLCSADPSRCAADAARRGSRTTTILGPPAAGLSQALGLSQLSQRQVGISMARCSRAVSIVRSTCGIKATSSPLRAQLDRRRPRQTRR